MMSDEQTQAISNDRWSLHGDQISLIRAVQASQPVSFTAEPEALCVDMTRSAPIVIDMQSDFLDPAGWFA